MFGKRGRTSPAAAWGEIPAHSGGTVGLFVSILVRYPEVANITYRRETHSLKLTVLLRSRLPAPEAARFQRVLVRSVETYVRLSRRSARLVGADIAARDGVTVVELRRDIDSLTQTELAMLLTLVREFFGANLVVESLPPVELDELTAQEEYIEEMLDDLRDAPQAPNLIAFREEGRVLVFNQ